METERPKSQEEFDALVREEAERLDQEINGLSREEKERKIQNIRTEVEGYGLSTNAFSDQELIFLFVQKERERMNK